MDGRRVPGTILIVDDDPQIRVALGELLATAGYATIPAANGAEALAYLRAAPHPPALILLDLAMPVMDGWAFCAARRHDPTLARIPLVLVTAGGGPSRATPYIGVAAVLAKPYDPDALLATIERVASTHT